MTKIHQSVKLTVETITPARAADLLSRNKCGRRLRPFVVENLAKVMAAGKWKLNGESIIISPMDEPIDCQHRLSACVQSQTPFTTVVVYGIHEDAFDTIDCGQKRTAGQILQAAGCSNGNAVAAAMRYVKAIRSQSQQGGINITNEEVLQTFINDRRFSDSLPVALRAGNIITLGRGTALHYLFSQKDEKMAGEFFSSLSNGSELARDNPVFVLRERLIRERLGDKKRKIDYMEEMALIIRAWNLFRQGAKTTVLKGTVTTKPGEPRRWPEIM